MLAKRAHGSRLIVLWYGLLQINFVHIPERVIFDNEDAVRRLNYSESNLKK